MDLEGFGVVAGAVADLAVDINVREEMHLNALGALTLACLTAPALYVEAEPARLVTPDLGLAGLGEDFTDLVKYSRVRGGVGAGRSPDGGLVDLDDLVDFRNTVEGLEHSRLHF